jgi:hypothetical protein
MAGHERRSAIAQRLKPALALGVGVLLLGFNFAMLVFSERFFPLVLFAGCAMTTASMFGVAVGEPQDPYGDRPLWFRVGVVAAAIVGLLIALVLHIELTVE